MLNNDRKELGEELMSIRGYAGDELEADDPRVLALEPLQAVGTGELIMKRVALYENYATTKNYCFTPFTFIIKCKCTN